MLSNSETVIKSISLTKVLQVFFLISGSAGWMPAPLFWVSAASPWLRVYRNRVPCRSFRNPRQADKSMYIIYAVTAVKLNFSAVVEHDEVVHYQQCRQMKKRMSIVQRLLRVSDTVQSWCWCCLKCAL